MKKILILSNNAASETESNGRIHFSQLLRYKNSSNLFNFYVRGEPNVKNVKYLSTSFKNALKSKLFFIKFKNVFVKDATQKNTTPIIKKKTSFAHIVRNFAFHNNKVVLKELKKTILENNINQIILWGSNIPFLFEYGYKLSKSMNIPLAIINGENYPFKKYNYINKKVSFFYSLFRRQLYKWCKKAYIRSSLNIYLNEELMGLYENNFNIKGGKVIFFGSDLPYVDRKPKIISNIFYGGNLYADRVDSLCKIANYLKKYSNVKINVYGKCDDEISLSKIKECTNIVINGFITYDSLIKEMYKSDLLLHIEGFSDWYKKDCQYAFSTKISDYITSGIPFFFFGPKEISGIKYALNFYPNFVATNDNEINKIDKILLGKFDMPKRIDSFNGVKISDEIYDLLEANL